MLLTAHLCSLMFATVPQRDERAMATVDLERPEMAIGKS